MISRWCDGGDNQAIFLRTSVLLQHDSRTDKQGVYLHLASSLKNQ